MVSMSGRLLVIAAGRRGHNQRAVGVGNRRHEGLLMSGHVPIRQPGDVRMLGTGGPGRPQAIGAGNEQPPPARSRPTANSTSSMA